MTNAEEILNQAKAELAKENNYPSWGSVPYGLLEDELAKRCMEIASKEAADKAWEAAWNRFRQEEYGRVPPTLPNKETFMKELFKPVTI